MAPKKKDQQKMSLGAFLQEEKYGGSWADEVEDSFGSQPLPSSGTDRRTGYSSYGSGGGDRGYARDSYASQGPAQLPTKPPFTAHLGNLSYEATTESVTEFFEDCDITSVRIIEDRIEQRPKGFAYAEFANVEGLKKALTLDGTSFQGRTIKIKIADPPKERQDRGGDSARDLSSWERKGPLADLPSRGGDRRPAEFGERRGPGGFRDRDAAPPSDDGKVRDFGNWERKGPLSPLPQPERAGSRDSSRPRTHDANRGDSFRKDRRASPATWGEGRQEGSRPPREFKERTERPDRPERTERPERAPTAADLDNQWRNNMKPDRSVKSPGQSRDGSEAPPSPAPAAANLAAPVGRPRLNLQKRTVSESPDVVSPGLPSATGDSKASPFGAARPIDTAAKEREIAEKREQQLKEKKEADDKAKEERRIAKEAKDAAAKEAAEKAAAEAEKPKVVEPVEEKPEAVPETKEEEPKEGGTQAQNGNGAEQKLPIRPKDNVPNPKTTRAAESGNWRASTGERGRGGYVNASRGRGDARGRGAPRAPRGNHEGRPPRANGNTAAPSTQQSTQAPPPASEGEAAPAQSADGWTTVQTKPRHNNRTRA
ncbi:uncharacterized protein GGS22DRAFT_104225 [Annulohypoxylon maeteangense]|uniref:uncharacterized protein n=1 Tax=Annulohypoxylon maeteangense TaxID=1927788 RepID=UPI002008C192|nr:uncharacterized protein GGS22DRAFT_104225 [Annulohypoxylon maeteangense]KAI0887091.1 hypothetical protein GGS22DRAFT_104225 [Annulohypoxylon maeteangense]